MTKLGFLTFNLAKKLLGCKLKACSLTLFVSSFIILLFEEFFYKFVPILLSTLMTSFSLLVMGCLLRFFFYCLIAFLGE